MEASGAWSRAAASAEAVRAASPETLRNDSSAACVNATVTGSVRVSVYGDDGASSFHDAWACIAGASLVLLESAPTLRSVTVVALDGCGAHTVGDGAEVQVLDVQGVVLAHTALESREKVTAMWDRWH